MEIQALLGLSLAFLFFSGQNSHFLSLFLFEFSFFYLFMLIHFFFVKYYCIPFWTPSSYKLVFKSKFYQWVCNHKNYLILFTYVCRGSLSDNHINKQVLLHGMARNPNWWWRGTIIINRFWARHRSFNNPWCSCYMVGPNFWSNSMLHW